MLEILHEQHDNEYDVQHVTTEPVREMNEAYRALSIKYSSTIDLPVVG
jgi:hypothetical protein